MHVLLCTTHTQHTQQYTQHLLPTFGAVASRSMVVVAAVGGLRLSAVILLQYTTAAAAAVVPMKKLYGTFLQNAYYYNNTINNFRIKY